MHVIKVLKEDHARIEILLRELTETKENGEGDRQTLVERLERELTVHTIAEENIFLPHVEDAIEDSKRATTEFFDEDADVLNGAAELISQSYWSNGEIKTLLEDVGEIEMEDWEGKRDELRRVMALQIEREEELFTKAEKVLEDEDFERIGDLVEHCKWQVRGLAQAKLASSSSFRPALEKEVSFLLEGNLQENLRE